MAVSSEPIGDQVIQRASAGERSAQREIYEHFGNRMFRLVRRIVGESDADDVTQDSFIKIFAKLNTFRFESPFSTWLHRLVVNEALQHLRSRSRSNTRSRTIMDWDAVQPDGAAAIDNTELLEVAMSRIEPDLRVVFELKEVDQLPYAEIAEIVGIPAGTVGSRLNRARRELLQHLTSLGWEG